MPFNLESNCELFKSYDKSNIGMFFMSYYIFHPMSVVEDRDCEWIVWFICRW